MSARHVRDNSQLCVNNIFQNHSIRSSQMLCSDILRITPNPSKPNFWTPSPQKRSRKGVLKRVLQTQVVETSTKNFYRFLRLDFKNNLRSHTHMWYYIISTSCGVRKICLTASRSDLSVHFQPWFRWWTLWSLCICKLKIRFHNFDINFILLGWCVCVFAVDTHKTTCFHLQYWLMTGTYWI